MVPEVYKKVETCELDIQELGTVFSTFSKGISTVYQLTYIRNQQVIPDTEPAKLRFVLEASEKRS